MDRRRGEQNSERAWLAVYGAAYAQLIIEAIRNGRLTDEENQRIGLQAEAIANEEAFFFQEGKKDR